MIDTARSGFSLANRPNSWDACALPPAMVSRVVVMRLVDQFLEEVSDVLVFSFSHLLGGHRAMDVIALESDLRILIMGQGQSVGVNDTLSSGRQCARREGLQEAQSVLAVPLGGIESEFGLLRCNIVGE